MRTDSAFDGEWKRELNGGNSPHFWRNDWEGRRGREMVGYACAC